MAIGGVRAEKEVWRSSGAAQIFGETVRVMRELRGLTRRQLERSGRKSYSQLRGLELGDRWPTDHMLVAISKPLGFTPSALIETRDDLLRGVDEHGQLPGEVVAAWLDQLPAKANSQFVSRRDDQGADIIWSRDGRDVAVFEVKTAKGSPARVLAAPLDSGAGDKSVQDVSDQIEALKRSLQTNFSGWLTSGAEAASDPARLPAVPDGGPNSDWKGSFAARLREGQVRPRLAEMLHQATPGQLALVEAYLEGLRASGAGTQGTDL